MGSWSAAFQSAPVTKVFTPSAVVSSRRPSRPAGLSVALTAETANVAAPARSWAVTSTTAGRRQFSAGPSGSACATSVPFT